MSSNRDRERDIITALTERKAQENVQMFAELLHLRLERYKDSLVAVGNDMTRGRASEAKDILKTLDLL